MQFEARKGISYLSDVAIDDLSLSPECFGLNIPPEELEGYNYWHPPFLEPSVKEPHKDFINKTCKTWRVSVERRLLIDTWCSVDRLRVQHVQRARAPRADAGELHSGLQQLGRQGASDERASPGRGAEVDITFGGLLHVSSNNTP